MRSQQQRSQKRVTSRKALSASDRNPNGRFGLKRALVLLGVLTMLTLPAVLLGHARHASMQSMPGGISVAEPSLAQKRDGTTADGDRRNLWIGRACHRAVLRIRNRLRHGSSARRERRRGWRNE